MGVGQIGHMDIIADAGAVGRRIVGAEDGNVVTKAKGGLDRDLDQVGGGGGVLPGAARRIGAGHVEIAQNADMQAMSGRASRSIRSVISLESRRD